MSDDLGVEGWGGDFECHWVLLRVWLVMQGVRSEEFFGGHGADAGEKVQGVR